jgi:two-component system chemotaxis response regulator CheB
VNETNRNFISLLIADDSTVVRRAINGLLQDEPAIKVLGEAENFAQAVSMAASLKPDVILLDLHMPDDAVYETVFVRNQFSLCGSKVLAMSLSTKEDEENNKLAESFGAVAILDKAQLCDVLIPTILNQIE